MNNLSHMKKIKTQGTIKGNLTTIHMCNG